jgi:hypothetical protein
MREENRRVWEQLSTEKRKVDKLVGMVGKLWDIVGKGFPPGSGMRVLYLPPHLLTQDDSTTFPSGPVRFYR